MKWYVTFFVGFVSTLPIVRSEFNDTQESTLETDDDRYLEQFTRRWDLSSTRKKSAPINDEDRYVDRYLDNSFWYIPWWTIQRWYEELGEKKLKAFCAQVHKLAGYGEATVNAVLLMQRQLIFENVEYKVRRVDVVTYGIEEPVKAGEKRRYWHIMEGLRKECAFYLNLVNTEPVQYKFRKHVCGIKWK